MPALRPNATGERRLSPIMSLFLHSLVIALAIVFLTPLTWAAMTSVKTVQQFGASPMALPHPLILTNFVEAFTTRNYAFLLYLLNTLVITQIFVVGTVFSSSLVAYGFARFQFPLKRTLFACLIGTILLPDQVTMIPLFMIWKHLGFVDTIVPLITPAFLGGGAFNIFLLRQFYMQLPRSLDEAAMIDGCSPFGIWWRILMPLSKPALITVGLFAFTAAWQDFMNPLIYLQDMHNYTASLGLQLFNDDYGSASNAETANLPLLMAASVMHITPVIILFLVAQKHFIRGIATTGLKD